MEGRRKAIVDINDEAIDCAKLGECQKTFNGIYINLCD